MAISFWVASALLLPSARGGGQAPRPSESELKAVYLYNFGKFVRWPRSARDTEGDEFGVCVMGEDPFGPVLDATLEGETLDGMRAMPMRVAGVEEAKGCRILFISESEAKELGEILDALSETSVLTVSDVRRFSRYGGMIEFVLDGDRVRFDVNLAAARRAGLELSSELLRVARTVRED